MLDALPKADGTTNVTVATIVPSLQIIVQQVAAGALGTFDPMVEGHSAPFATAGDLPVQNSDMHWEDDMFVMVGTAPTDPVSLSVMLLDLGANVRTLQKLPMDVPTPAGVLRSKIAKVVARADKPAMLGAMGGMLHVAWTEERYSDGDPADPWQEMYYDQLVCYPVGDP